MAVRNRSTWLETDSGRSLNNFCLNAFSAGYLDISVVHFRIAQSYACSSAAQTITKRSSFLNGLDDGAGCWNWFVVLAKRFEVGIDSVFDASPDFVEGVGAGRAAGQIGQLRGIASVVGLFDNVDEFHVQPHFSPACRRMG